MGWKIILQHWTSNQWTIRGWCRQKIDRVSQAVSYPIHYPVLNSFLTRIINPATGKPVASYVYRFQFHRVHALTHIPLISVSEAGEKDIDLAVAAAQAAYETAWGLKVPGHQRGRLLLKLAELIEKNAEELGALEALDNGEDGLHIQNVPISHNSCPRFRKICYHC